MGLYYKGDANFAFRSEPRCIGLRRLRSRTSASAEADLPGGKASTPAYRRPGARTPRARDRNSMERSVVRRAARLARDGARNLLRHLAHRHRADRAVLSGHGERRRSAAVPRMRAALAAALSRRAAEHRAHFARRHLRAGVLPQIAEKAH